MARNNKVTVTKLQERLRRTRGRNQARAWTTAEERFVARKYARNANAILSTVLRRSVYSIEHKARSLGVSKVG